MKEGDAVTSPGHAPHDPSAQALDAANAHRLGARRASYAASPPPRNLGLGKSWPGYAILGVAGGSALVCGLAQDQSFMLIIALLLLAFGGVVMALTVVSSRITGGHGTDRLDFFDRGLVVTAKGSAYAFPFDSSLALQGITDHKHAGSVYRTTYFYTLVARDGGAVMIGDASPGIAMVHTATYNPVRGAAFPDPEQWGPAIQQSITAAQLPAAASGVREGRTLHFGPLAVDREALSADGVRVPWNRIEGLKLNEGWLTVRAEGRWTAVSKEPVHAIPNFFVFHALAEQLLAETRG